jgi:hypothetical protein
LAVVFLTSALLFASTATVAEDRPVFQVGPERDYLLPSEVAEIAPDGAIVEIDAGQYFERPAVWTQSRLTIRGVGGRAHMAKSRGVEPTEALWIFTGDEVEIENLAFTEFRHRTRNPAAVQLDGLRLTVVDCYFYSNATGIVSTNPAATLTVERTEFDRNGVRNNAGHAIYARAASELTVRSSYVHGNEGGTHIKSAASLTQILYNRLTDEITGRADAIIDATGSADTRIIGNIIHKSDDAIEGEVIVHRGGSEDPARLVVAHNTIVSSHFSGGFVTTEGNAKARLLNNLFVGRGPALVGSGDNIGTVTASREDLHRAREFHYRLRPGAAAIDSGTELSGEDAAFLPDTHYVHPMGSVPRPSAGALDAGALEYSNQNPVLLALPANQWVRLNTFGDAPRRSRHSGAIYDPRKHRLLIFGSETHGFDWDNAVHEFDALTQEWRSHYEPSRPGSYRTDGNGRRIAGSGPAFPWAMHTYDNLVYDPSTHSLVVTSSPGHNPAPAPNATNPTWIYDLETDTWRIHENDDEPNPTFFAGGSTYDSQRDTIVAYSGVGDFSQLGVGQEDQGGRTGVWELGPDRKKWLQAHPDNHHIIHYMVDYDAVLGKVVVFGGVENELVWVYTPGAMAGERGAWEKVTPQGDPLPKSRHHPVAFDLRAGVCLLVVPDEQAEASHTYIYDLATNTARELPDGDIFHLAMNYMMVYDDTHGVFILVTGSFHRNRFLERTEVYALRLDPSLLD